MSKAQSSKKIEMLVQLSSVINSSLDIVEVLNNAIRFVEELIDAEGSSIFEVDDTTNELFFRVLRGEAVHRAKEIRMKFGEGVVGWVAVSGEPVIISDTEKDARFSSKVDLITGLITKSIIALPIKNKGSLIGILELINKRGSTPFNAEDLEVLTIVANQIGIAIANAKLYERLQEKFSLTRAELKKTQEQLIRSERLSALGQLSQGVAHEVRNPVMSIGGFARRLKNKLQHDKTLGGYADIIIKEAARLEQMVKDIEQYATMSEPDIHVMKLSTLLQYTLTTWEREPYAGKIEIKLQSPPEDPTISADKAQMAQALINLFRNSAEAMPDGGTISVSSSWEGNYLAICVKDNGPGIGPEDLPRIFDPFFTAKPKGSGLGLTAVNRIVSDHRGEVKVSSKPNTGTEVKLYLPRFSDSYKM
ncbi:MAG: GAF domain-containing protein [Desulfobacterales bacterium]|nr:GAF domain-containing protein [Desulfobacterales bacterium]MBL7101813.1 GAF domain-containing protein [Desulfobacteraceae bacterium]